jgi:hypothetical protein
VSDVDKLLTAYRNLQVKNAALKNLYQDNYTKAPTAVSRDAKAQMARNDEQLGRSREKLIEMGIDESSLGWAPIIWLGIIAVPAILSVAGYGIYAYINACNKEAAETDKKISVYKQMGAAAVEKIWPQESPLVQIRPAAAGFGLGAALAIAAGIYFLVKS